LPFGVDIFIARIDNAVFVYLFPLNLEVSAISCLAAARETERGIAGVLLGASR
jgi:hypothetical protein